MTLPLKRRTNPARDDTQARRAHTLSFGASPMDARTERGMARIHNAASAFGSRVCLEDAPPIFDGLVARLRTSDLRLIELATEQYQLSPRFQVDGRTSELVRRRLRREYMIPLTRIGRKLFHFAPTVEQTLKVPHARSSHRELVIAAQSMLKAVWPHRGVLLSAGFPRTFFRQFRDLTRQLKQIATTTSERQREYTRVSRELREELASANETLRMLEGLVLGRMDTDSLLKKAWKDVTRTPKRLGRPPAKKRKLSPNEPEARGPHIA
jgi:hypothetical protein